jgi:WS/DGAT/MGAT family acyltransferase
VLLVSATIGEGHNATARGIEEALHRVWPDCEVSWVDALHVMGRGVGPVFRWIYRVNVDTTPWLYNFFYAALWRYRWFADASRRFVGSWCGRRLRRVLVSRDPDLVISTYPMGTAGLDWLRRRGELPMPVAAVISDFSPHPFWVYPNIDLHYAMSEASLRELYRAMPEAAGAISAPPVVSAFHPQDKSRARLRCGLPESGFVVLVSCGSLGFGSIERAVVAALTVSEVDTVVVACGRNEELRRRLETCGDHRLVPLGWIEDMATLTAAADVVVTNAGGATALEALACGRAVAMFEPIAGHGRANAETMARAGLAELCPAPQDLVATVRKLARDPDSLAELEARATAHAGSGDFIEQVRALASLPRRSRCIRLRGQDAFFLHATTPAVPQQTGAILHLEGAADAKSTDQLRRALTELIRHRAPHVPMLHRRLVPRPGRRAVWIDEPVDPAAHLRCRDIAPACAEQWDATLEDFFATPAPADRPPWQLLLLREPGRTVLAAKLHHALGDGVAVTSALGTLLHDNQDATPARTVEEASRWPWRMGEVARGLATLARAGRAPISELDGPSTPGRRFGRVSLDGSKVRASARTHGVSRSVLLLTVLAEALHRLLDERGGTTAGQRLRIMVPQTTRTHFADAAIHSPGNHTATVSVDLPVGPMSPTQRLAEVTERLAAPQREGQPAAAALVLAALGPLPEPLHAWVVRRIYQRRFFNVVVSVLPGPRRPVRVAGTLVSMVTPVLPLADGVGLAVGMISGGEMVGVGITLDARLGSMLAALAEYVRAAFDDLQEPHGSPR